MNPTQIVVYRSQTELFWDNAIMNGDAVVYGFWILVGSLAIVGSMFAFYKVKEYLTRRRPHPVSPRRYRGERWYEQS